MKFFYMYQARWLQGSVETKRPATREINDAVEVAKNALENGAQEAHIQVMVGVLVNQGVDTDETI